MRSVLVLTGVLALLSCKESLDVRHPCTGVLVRGQVVGSVQSGPTAVPRVRLPDGTEVAASPGGRTVPVGWRCPEQPAAAAPDGGTLEPGQAPEDTTGWVLVAPGGAVVGRFPPGAKLGSLPPGFQAVHESAVPKEILEKLDEKPAPAPGP
jgi:hypothetical protein